MSTSYQYSSTISFFYFNHHRHKKKKTISIPIDSPSIPNTPFPINGPDPAAAAATKIQAAFRAHLVRTLINQIRSVDTETGRIERLIQQQDTVDAIRGDARERLRVGESLMALILKLDAVPGFYPHVRDLRRRVCRRIVGLQEVLDAIVGAPAAAAAVPGGSPASWEEGAVEIGGCEGWGAAADPDQGFEWWERFLFGSLK